METNVNYTVAGLFVITLLGCIIFGIIWLSSGLSSQHYTYYRVYMQESVSGLTIDAPVEFNGVNVGAVENIKINRENPHLIQLLLKVQHDTPITRGTKAKLGMRALTGVAFILLDDRGTDQTPLTAVNGQEYPVIETEPSTLLRLDAAITEIKESFNELSASVQSLLNEHNLKSIKEILENSQKSLYLLQTQTLPAANRAAASFEDMTDDLSSVAAEIKQNPGVLIRGTEGGQVKGPGE